MRPLISAVSCNAFDHFSQMSRYSSACCISAVASRLLEVLLPPNAARMAFTISVKNCFTFSRNVFASAGCWAISCSMASESRSMFSHASATTSSSAAPSSFRLLSRSLIRAAISSMLAPLLLVSTSSTARFSASYWARLLCCNAWVSSWLMVRSSVTRESSDALFAPAFTSKRMVLVVAL